MKQRKMAKSVKTDLNRYLKELSREELEKEIKKLYTKFNEIKKYYEMELSHDTTAILNEYKLKIKQEYFPKRGYGKARNKESRKVVANFKKISIYPKDVIELLLYRVEMMIAFTNAYGDIDEPFYNSLESSFEEACKLIQHERLVDEYTITCHQLIDQTHDFGWGLYEGLKYSYDRYLNY